MNHCCAYRFVLISFDFTNIEYVYTIFMILGRIGAVCSVCSCRRAENYATSSIVVEIRTAEFELAGLHT